jgi:parallel beta-helix repeat protein
MYGETVPTVYENTALTFTENINKCVEKINDLIDYYNEHYGEDLTDIVTAILETWEGNGTFDEIIETVLGTPLTAHLADNPMTPMRQGAVGNGSTDDTTAFQAAITAAAAGDIIDLGGHSFAVTGLTIGKKLHVMNGKIILLNSGTASAVEIESGGAGSRLSDIEIYINNALIAGSDLSGIWINGADDVTLENCRVTGGKNENYADPYMHSSIYALDADRVTILDCFVTGAECEGIMCEGCNDVLIRGCQAYDCGLSGIGTSEGVRAVIDNCQVFDSGASGITMNSQDGRVTNSLVKDNASQNGITAGHSTPAGQYAENCIIKGNHVINAYQHGISVNYFQHAVIEGNNIDTAGQTGINLIPNPGLDGNMAVLGNVIDDCGNIGIYAGAAAADNTVNFNLAGNVISNCDGIGIKVQNNGDNNIQNNIIKSVHTGLQVHGAYMMDARIGSMLSACIQGNQIIGTQYSGIYIFNVLRVQIVNNGFYDINTEDDASSHVIKTVGAVPGGTAKLPLPNPFVITGNMTKTISASSVFAYIADCTYDQTVKVLAVKDNVLNDILPNMQLYYVITQYSLVADMTPFAKIGLATGNQTIPNNVLTKIDFETSLKDNFLMVDEENAALVCKRAGWYMISGQVSFVANNTGERLVAVYLNGNILTGVGAVSIPGGSVLSFGIPYQLALNDIITVYVRQQSGDNLNVYSDSYGTRTWLSMKRIADD